MNAILIAGARTTYAAARDTAGLARLRGWHVARGTPRAAIVATAALALALVGFGAYTRGGFATMVDYLSPVYWLFLTLSGIALLRAAAPISRRAAAVSRAVVSAGCRSRSSRAAPTCCTRAWPMSASAPSPASAVLTAGVVLLAALRLGAKLGAALKSSSGPRPRSRAGATAETP